MEVAVKIFQACSKFSMFNKSLNTIKTEVFEYLIKLRVYYLNIKVLLEQKKPTAPRSETTWFFADLINFLSQLDVNIKLST